MALCKEALSIVARIVNQAAAAGSLEVALEINGQGRGGISCVDAYKEGEYAFLEKLKPKFKN